MLSLIGKASDHPRALLERYNEMNVFMPANTTSPLKFMDQSFQVLLCKEHIS